MDLDQADRELLRILQHDFPIVPQPYKELAERLGWDEDTVISKMDTLIKNGIIRKFGAKISPRNMGFISTLAAMTIPESQMDFTVKIINSYNGVTHNYLRDVDEGNPNLWFTLTEPDDETLNAHLKQIEEKTGNPVIRLPATKIFKIGVKLDV
jgi:DNA-binding Lrp family transcriptional regulator